MPALAGRRWSAPLLLLLFCAILFFYGSHAGALWRTESLRAIVAAEMLHSGNWLVPTLYGEPLLTKPPGMYVAIALASWPIGQVTDGSARLPSALAASATVFLFYWYFGRVLGRRAGLVAAVILPVSVLWLDKAPSAEIDMVQLFWVSAAILLVLRALDGRAGDVSPPVTSGPTPHPNPPPQGGREPEATFGGEAQGLPPPSGGEGWGGGGKPPASGHRLVWWVLALLCVAGGFLTKWTAPAFFYLMLVPLLAWRRQLRLLFSWQHLFSAALAGSLCLAWAAAVIQQVGWEELAGTVQREALQRLSARHFEATQQQLGANHHDKLPYWLGTLTHPFAVLAMTLPWSALALLTLRPGFLRLWVDRGRLLLQGLHCWAWPNLLLWSLSPDHSPRYSLPLVPALSGLAALVVIAWMNGARLTRRGWIQDLEARRVSEGGATEDLCACPSRTLRASNDAQRGAPPTLALAPKGGGDQTGRLRGSACQDKGAALLLGVLAVWLLVKVVYVEVVIPHRLGRREQPRPIAAELAAAVPPGETLYLCRVKDEGIMFYYGRPVRRLASFQELPSPGEPLYCMLNESEWRALDRPAEAVLHLRDQQRDPIVLVKVLR